MIILYSIILILCFPTVSWGYIDPGSVSIFLQVIFAFLLGGFFAFRNKVINGIKSVFHFMHLKKKDPSEDKSNENED